MKIKYCLSTLVIAIVIFVYLKPFGITANIPYASAEVNSQNLALHVSLKGNDNWSGKLPEPNAGLTDGPFASLERARDAIREIKKQGALLSGGVTVYLRGGVYSRDKTFHLTIEDSGTRESPIVYRAFENEEVIMSGGKQIDGFKPVKNKAILKRFSEQVRDKVLEIDLGKIGISNFGKMMPRGFLMPKYPAHLELFFDDEPMTVARYPNEGWVRIADVPQTGELKYKGAYRESKPMIDRDGIIRGRHYGRIVYDDDRPDKWSSIENVWLFGYWLQDWADQYQEIAKIDTKTKEIYLAEPYHRYGFKKGKRYYYLNILEELDSPGEWYLDGKSGVLYFYPPSSVTTGKAFVSLLEDPMIVMDACSFVTFRDISFKYSRGNGIEIRDGVNNRIAGCTICNIGNNAVEISGGMGHGVLSCNIYNTGDGGIALRGGDRLTLTPGNHFAHNNHIHHFSRWVKTYNPAVRIDGAGNYIVNNLIHDAPHSAILLGGNDHVIEYNEIHGVALETSDVGAFYMGRNWTTRGNKIRFNYFHHLGAIGEGVGTMAVYIDDAACGALIYGNVVYKSHRAVMIGGGHDNIIENNIFIDCDPVLHLDGRSLTWAKELSSPGGSWQMYEKLKEVRYNEPPYSLKYPELPGILDGNPQMPKGNKIMRNVIAGNGKWVDFLHGMDSTVYHFKNNHMAQYSEFVNLEGGNLRLKNDSPAFYYGFEEIPWERIGLFTDEHRKFLPNAK